MAAIVLFQNREIRRRRIFRERINPLLYMNDQEVEERYRIPRAGIEELIQMIEDDVSPVCTRSHALDATTKTLITLRYLAKGNFYSETGDIHGVSRSSVSRAIAEVVAALNQRLSNIQFPTNDAELLEIKRKFYQAAGIPNVIGAVDGTLIPIIAPKGQDEPAYVCRKGYHAINVQAVVGPDMRFTDVVAKWPGSQHDASTFESCGLKSYLENHEIGWLLGDSGYPLRKYLITPKPNPMTDAENRFNVAHSQTRIVVERAFGVLKSRFRCLHKSGGVMPFTPAKCCQITVLCMKLHNKCIDMGIPIPDITEADRGDFDNVTINEQNNNSATQIRQTLINNF